jgi:pimeloyl-ACP methyl ester carboxylesterase
VLTPTHPGWEGTPRPAQIDSVPALAAAYLGLLDREDLGEVLVVGNSLGGWIGMEMAAADAEGRIGRLVLVDSVGIEVEGEPIVDFFELSPREVTEVCFHNPDAFYMDPAEMPAEMVAAQTANMETLKAIAGDPYMHDPGLALKLPGVEIPVLAIYGESDGLSTPAYGRTLAGLFPNSRFELVHEAGHLPQLEAPEATLSLITGFAA